MPAYCVLILTWAVQTAETVWPHSMLFFAQRGFALPDYLQNIQAGSFPCYTKTPSGGFHLHFKYKATKLYILAGSLA